LREDRSVTTWTAPVRFAEVDAQEVVFNSHYLLYCDEAATTFLLERGLRDIARNVRLVTSQLTWSGAARWGDDIAVAVHCADLGRTSFVLEFEITASGRDCCSVRTTYVLADPAGRPTPVPAQARELMRSPVPGS
jgi:acyl-CoA thioester hydrolase